MLSDWQRGHATPLGQRKAVNCSLHFSSLPNCAKSLGRFMSALKDVVGLVFMFMPKLKKTAHKMTEKELLHSVFPKEVIRHIKKFARKHRTPRKTISIPRTK